MSDRFKEFTPVERLLIYQALGRFSYEVGTEDQAGKLQEMVNALQKESWPVEEEVDVILTSVGGKYIYVIKAVRASIPGIGLAEAKRFVDNVKMSGPELLATVDRETANIIKKNIESEGGQVEIK